VGNDVASKEFSSSWRSSATLTSSFPARICATHSESDGPGHTGPAIVTVSSVNMVTSSGMEFMRSNGDWS
jgi:hypothetical protein